MKSDILDRAQSLQPEYQCPSYNRESNVKFNIHKCKDEITVLVFSTPFFCSCKPILDYIDAQFEKYLEEELKIKRSLWNYHDTRIHACLYFIAPTGHSLKSLDLITMKKLDSKVVKFSISVYFISSFLLDSQGCHS